MKCFSDSPYRFSRQLAPTVSNRRAEAQERQQFSPGVTKAPDGNALSGQAFIISTLIGIVNHLAPPGNGTTGLTGPPVLYKVGAIRPARHFRQDFFRDE